MRWSLAAVLFLAASAAHAAPQQSALQAAVDEANRLAAEAAGLPDAPRDVNLSNSVKGKHMLADAPKPTVKGQVKTLGVAGNTGADWQKLASQAALDAMQAGKDPPAASEVFGDDARATLARQIGPDAYVNHVPTGYVVEITGELWLPGDGHSPPRTTVAENGGYTNTIDFNPGGAGFYGSATTYDVKGDMITIHKALQVGDQTMVIPNLQVRSGQTVVVQTPDGSVMQITPVLKKK